MIRDWSVVASGLEEKNTFDHKNTTTGKYNSKEEERSAEAGQVVFICLPTNCALLRTTGTRSLVYIWHEPH